MKTATTTQRLFLLGPACLFITFSSCSDDDKPVAQDQVQTKQVSNLFAPQTGGQGQPVGGDFTKFDFETGLQTTSDTDWDIAFRGTTIAVNGGVATGTSGEPVRTGDASAAIATGTFASVTTAAGITFTQDSATGFAIPAVSNAGWYNYNFQTNLVTPIPGRVLVFKTRNGHFAKIEILSYYQNAPANPDPNVDAGRYYTFNYAYNPTPGAMSFEQ